MRRGVAGVGMGFIVSWLIILPTERKKNECVKVSIWKENKKTREVAFPLVAGSIREKTAPLAIILSVN